MNSPQLLASRVSIETLVRPRKLESALFFQVTSMKGPCCGKGCCIRGKSIPCVGVYPHAQGILVEKRDGSLLINNKDEKKLKRKPKLEYLEIKDKVVLGWQLTCRIHKAIKHPWGAIVIQEVTTLEDSNPQGDNIGFVIWMLIAPKTT